MLLATSACAGSGSSSSASLQDPAIEKLVADTDREADAIRKTARAAKGDQDFEYALQLTMKNEGTDYDKAEGSRQTLTDDGVTFGAIGFTSRNGELYEVLKETIALSGAPFDFVVRRPAGLEEASRFWDAYRAGWEVLLVPRDSRKLPFPHGTDDPLAKWALEPTTFPSGKPAKTPREVALKILKAIGSVDDCRTVQRARAYQSYRDYTAFASRWFSKPGYTPSREVKAFVFDLLVLSDGPPGDGAWRMASWHSEKERVTQIVKATTERLRKDGSAHAKTAPSRWQPYIDRASGDKI